ncbi:unnamed protein product [Dicrocoelium dendriticum]|nr:unnamed protein product [Dicrocoelium dendriticum]
MVTTTSGSASGLQAHGLHQSGGFAIAKTSACSSNECATSIASAVEEFELADLSTGSAGGVDDLDNQLTVSNLSKSLAEENLFRNPHTIPPPKKQKRKPAPIFIPPQKQQSIIKILDPSPYNRKTDTHYLPNGWDHLGLRIAPSSMVFLCYPSLTGV